VLISHLIKPKRISAIGVSLVFLSLTLIEMPDRASIPHNKLVNSPHGDDPNLSQRSAPVWPMMRVCVSGRGCFLVLRPLLMGRCLPGLSHLVWAFQLLAVVPADAGGVHLEFTVFEGGPPAHNICLQSNGSALRPPRFGSLIAVVPLAGSFR